VTATSGEATLAYTSVLTTIRILETKGYVTHRQEGRAFLYTTSIGEVEASRSEVRHLLHRFFGNSRSGCCSPCWGRRDQSDELKRLKEAIANTADETLEGA